MQGCICRQAKILLTAVLRSKGCGTQTLQDLSAQELRVGMQSVDGTNARFCSCEPSAALQAPIASDCMHSLQHGRQCLCTSRPVLEGPTNHPSGDEQLWWAQAFAMWHVMLFCKIAGVLWRSWDVAVNDIQACSNHLSRTLQAELLMTKHVHKVFCVIVWYLQIMCLNGRIHVSTSAHVSTRA